jgi:NADH-quinone oxidoreductase subunit L
MGGLWKKIPWTFGTMAVATIAIAGIPPFAGFFSKDEILWRAYESNWIFWLVGLLTAFITSFYMFRLLFMTFFGEYRGPIGTEHSHEDHAASHGHGHGGIHESPWVMLGPLVILAVLSIVGGWVGIHHRFDDFLAPVFASNASAATAFEGGAATRSDEAGLETTLMLLYSAVANKYWIDEFYTWIFVKPLVAVSSVVFWRGIDQGVIDATLDGSADTAREVSDNLRHMQSGNLRSYAGWVAVGATAVIAYMVWIGTR